MAVETHGEKNGEDYAGGDCSLGEDSWGDGGTRLRVSYYLIIFERKRVQWHIPIPFLELQNYEENDYKDESNKASPNFGVTPRIGTTAPLQS